MCFLPDTAVQGHLQGAEWQDLLPILLQQALLTVILPLHILFRLPTKF
jgi:hypothetical protein